jgi:hypothetical protein
VKLPALPGRTIDLEQLATPRGVRIVPAILPVLRQHPELERLRLIIAARCAMRRSVWRTWSSGAPAPTPRFDDAALVVATDREVGKAGPAVKQLRCSPE